MEKDRDIKTAGEKLKYLSEDEEMRRIAELKEKARRDAVAVEQFNIQRGLEKGFKQGMENGMKQGIKQGIEKGIKKGIEQNRIAIVKNMLDKKMDINLIAEITGLSQDEIVKL